MISVETQGMEKRIAEDMVLIADYLARLMDGVRSGDWHAAEVRADQLGRHVEDLKFALRYEADRRRGTPARPDVVVTAIQQAAGTTPGAAKLI